MKNQAVTFGNNKKRKGKGRTPFWSTDLAAVKVHKPHVIWYFELSFVKEKAGWHTYNVRSGSKKELWEEKICQ